MFKKNTQRRKNRSEVDKRKSILKLSPVIGFDGNFIKLSNGKYLGVYRAITKDIYFLNRFERELLFEDFYYTLKSYNADLKYVSIDRKIDLKENIEVLEKIESTTEGEAVRDLIKNRIRLLESVSKVAVEKDYYIFAYFDQFSLESDVRNFLDIFSKYISKQMDIFEAADIVEYLLNKEEVKDIE